MKLQQSLTIVINRVVEAGERTERQRDEVPLMRLCTLMRKQVWTISITMSSLSKKPAGHLRHVNSTCSSSSSSTIAPPVKKKKERGGELISSSRTEGKRRTSRIVANTTSSESGAVASNRQ